MTEFREGALSEMDGLYHCTSFKGLTSILRSRAFYPFFCLEEASYLKEVMRFAFAVVCFADLRRGELEEHIINFSSDVYVKMSKEWAIRMNVSPVTYYSEKSTLSSAIYRALVDYASNHKNEREIFYPVNLMLGLLKQYRGHYYDKKRKAFSPREVCFYLEREWRYLPLVENGEAYYLDESDFLNEKLRQAKQQELVSRRYILDFTWDDVLEIGCNVEHKDALVEILTETFTISTEEASSKINERSSSPEQNRTAT